MSDEETFEVHETFEIEETFGEGKDLIAESAGLLQRIEALFATVDEKNLRYATRDLERLVRQIKDPVMRRQYEAAIDQLPEIATQGEAD